MKSPPLSTDEIALFKRRLGLLGLAFSFVLALLVWRLWTLQIVRGDYFQEVARSNRFRLVPQAGPRGLIYDRNGELLVYNRPAFNVQLVREDTADLAATLRNLARVTGIAAGELRRRMTAAEQPLPFAPIVLIEDAGRRIAALVESYQADLPGISVVVEPRRLYPQGAEAAHVVGYVGAVTKAQQADQPPRRRYSSQVSGQAGIEASLDSYLIGWDGGRQVEVDSIGRVLQTLGQPVRALPGSSVFLTLDRHLQAFVEDRLGDRSGAVIVSRPRTGEILAMASTPDFDPNVFVGGIPPAQWQALRRGETHPLVNKAVQGEYPPGSTFKMVLATAALDTGTIDPETTIFDPGYFRVGRHTFLDWKPGGHGEVTLREAIEQSCNVFFYQLGMMLGVDTIAKYARLFGFGSPTGVEFPDEKAGLIPDRVWKERTFGEPWYDGETPTVAIGQGFVSATPLQLLDYVNVIANRGLWVRPTILRRVVAPDGTEAVSGGDLPRNTRLLPVAPEVFDVIREGMVMAVSDRGTAWRARSPRFTVAGKTGTAQVVGRASQANTDEPGRVETEPHALFLGFAPAESPQVSVLVLVEHGGSGGQVAAPLARSILDFYDREIEVLEAPGVESEGPGAAIKAAQRGGEVQRLPQTGAIRAVP